MKKIYSLLLMATLLLVSGNMWAAGDATAETGVCRIASDYYSSLTSALSDVPTDGTETTIIMVKDVEIETNPGFSILSTQNVVLDLNGHTIKSLSRLPKTSYLIKNCGTLTVKDASDVEKNGTGTGALIGNALRPDETSIPGYASNTIVNYGHLFIESGFIESKGTGSASYAIDNEAENAQGEITIDHVVSLVITGGKFRSNESNTIRQYMDTEGVYENTISITNADMGSLWMQDNKNSQASRGSLSINNSVFCNSVILGYFGISANYRVSLANSSFTSIFDRLVNTGTNNTMDVENCSFSGYFYMYDPMKVLKNGLFANEVKNATSDYHENKTCSLADMVQDGYVVAPNKDPETTANYPYTIGTPVATITAEELVAISSPISAPSSEYYLDMNFWGMVGMADEAGNLCPQYVPVTDNIMYRDLAVEEGEDEDWVSAKYIFDNYFAQGKGYANSQTSYIYHKDMITRGYASLANAVASVPTDGTETTIVMVADDAIGNFEGTAVNIPAGTNIVLDLAGWTISGTATNAGTSQLINIANGAIVTIKDSGTNGVITYNSTQPDQSWTYGTYTINNVGTLTLKSGRIENTTVNGASYAVENHANWQAEDVTFNMEGGVVTCPEGDLAVRLYSNWGGSMTTVGKSIMNMTGGTIEAGGIWVNDQVAKGTGGFIELNISGENTVVNGMLDFLGAKDQTVVNITNGIFDCPKLRLRNSQSYNNTKPYVNITGGKWTIDAIDNQNTNQSIINTMVISKGVFAFENGDVITPYIPAESMVIDNTDPETKEDYPYTIGITHLKDGDELIIGGDLTLPVDLIVESGANVEIANGATLTVDNIYLHGTHLESAQILGDGNIELNVNGKAFFDWQPAADGNFTKAFYYAVAVPFEVDVLTGIKGLDAQGVEHNVVRASDYLIWKYDPAVRAAQRKVDECWIPITTGNLEPGVFYLVAFGTNSYKTYRFVKNDDASLNNYTSVLNYGAYPSSLDDGENHKGWNGLANNGLAYVRITNDIKFQVLGNKTNTFVTYAYDDIDLVVGCPFFYQASSTGALTTQISASVAAPARMSAQGGMEEVAVRLFESGASDFSDQVFLSVSSDAMDSYEAGKDLSKMFVGTPAAPQLWVNAYGEKLSANNAVLTNNSAMFNLSLYAAKTGTYALSLKNVAEDMDVYLMNGNAVVANLNDGIVELSLSQGEHTEYSIVLSGKHNIVTDVETLSGENGAKKMIINGHMYILHNGIMYNINGNIVK